MSVDYTTSYQSIVESFGYEVLVSETMGSDQHFLLRDGEKYAYLEVTYGQDHSTPQGSQSAEEFAAGVKGGLDFKLADELAAELQDALDQPNGTRWCVYDSEIRILLLGKVIPALVKPDEAST